MGIGDQMTRRPSKPVGFADNGVWRGAQIIGDFAGAFSLLPEQPEAGHDFWVFPKCRARHWAAFQRSERAWQRPLRSGG
jgi:hypothetical protein